MVITPCPGMCPSGYACPEKVEQLALIRYLGFPDNAEAVPEGPWAAG